VKTKENGNMTSIVILPNGKLELPEDLQQMITHSATPEIEQIAEVIFSDARPIEDDKSSNPTNYDEKVAEAETVDFEIIEKSSDLVLEPKDEQSAGPELSVQEQIEELEAERIAQENTPDPMEVEPEVEPEVEAESEPDLPPVVDPVEPIVVEIEDVSPCVDEPEDPECPEESENIVEWFLNWLGQFWIDLTSVKWWREHWKVVSWSLVLFICLIIFLVTVFSDMTTGELTDLQKWDNTLMTGKHLPGKVWTTSRLIWFIISTLGLLISGPILIFRKKQN